MLEQKIEFKKWVEDRRKALILKPELWQYNLFDTHNLLKFGRERKINIFNKDTLNDLWSVGFLRADIVSSKKEIKDLDLINKEDDIFYYLDNRVLETKPNGYGGCLSNCQKYNDIKLLFHPFRLYVLYHIDRVFGLNITSTQFLLNPNCFKKLIEIENNHKTEWTSNSDFCERFDYWNIIAEIAIILEPCYYEKIFQSIVLKNFETEDSYTKKLSAYKKETINFITENNFKNFEKIRESLCLASETIDDNKVLHVLLRLSSERKRKELKGDIGASMLLMTMAEVIRRAEEEALNRQLKEEDELGFGTWMSGARKILYGTERVFDAKKSDLKDFLSEFNLDFGVKVRCYVEGETELGFIKYAFQGFDSIEIINLRGQFVQKNKLSFRETLENDLKSKIFSYVVLDNDRQDNVKVVKKAAQEDIFSGAFYIFNPDIEKSFSDDELIEAILLLKKEENNKMELENEEEKRVIIKEAVINAKSGKELFTNLSKQPDFCNISKGEKWGESLAKVVLSKEITSKGYYNIFEFLKYLYNSTRCKFDYNIRKSKTDPNTGKIISRE